MKIEKVNKSNISNIDFDNLNFGSVFTDHMFICSFKNGEWSNPEIKPYQPISISPSARVFHYGQACFEGMKAQTSKDGRVSFFRPSLNWERMRLTASRLLMPEVPKELFIQAIEETVAANYSWIPPYGSGAALYVRPLLIGVGENLGLSPAEKYEFRVFVSPVGPYYKESGLAVINLAVSDMDRAAPNGTGNFKA